MNFLIFVVIAIVIAGIISYFGKKIFKPLVVIKTKKKYEILSFVITVLLGTITIALIGVDRNPYMAGGFLGIIEGMVNCSIVLDNKR